MTDVDIDATTPRIRPHPDRTGVQLLDPIQSDQFALLTPEPVDPLPCDTDRFYLPMDTAASLDTDVVETPYRVGGWVRDHSGETVAELEGGTELALSSDRYSIELTLTGLKVELNVEGPLVIESADDRVRFRVEGTVHVGVRSLHEQPAATVTTTDDPTDVMAAVSTLGSALKTTSSERSFPTLRGHPPLIERGETLSIPDGLEPPDTGVSIEVPPSFDYIYPVAPLAYYLGASVEPGVRPRITTADWEYPLAGAAGFEDTVARVLKQVFLLDCVVRTEGYYQVDLHERQSVAEATDLAIADLYGRPLAERLRAYMTVPWETLTETIPTWKLTADVEPDPAYVDTLPFLAHELAVVRCPDTVSGLAGDQRAQQAESLVRGNTTGPVRGNAAETRSESSTAQADPPLVYPDAAESIEQVYVGDGVPFGASKMTADAYRRRLEYEPSTDPHISVVVVCNDEQMAEENVVSDIYGTREWIEFDIVFEEDLTTTELREVFRRDADFLHYIGHVDDEGIRCADGHLDARELSDVNVSAFILNACESYDQGTALVDHGAMAGIATLADVNIDLATSVGRTVARFLNQGFSLAATMSLVGEHEAIGHKYLVVGDASLSVVRNESGTPYCVEIDKLDADTYEVTMFGYPRIDSHLGTLFLPHVNTVSQYYLNSGTMASFTLPRRELETFLNKQQTPIISDNTLCWGQDFLKQN